jgi:HD domain-containing protein
MLGALGHHGPIIAVRGARATVCRTATSVRSRHMNDILVLPKGALADASLAIARSSVSPSIVDHSIRSFLFARLLADDAAYLNDADYDEDLLFAATVMHDLGLGEHATGEARFEVEGADLAAAVLRKHRVAERDIDRVWEAIALHSSLGIAHRRGLLTSLTHKGVFIDAGRITDAIAGRLQEEVLNAYPRPAGDRSIADAIVAHATRSEAAAPPGSLAFELLRQHREAERARVRHQEST